MAFLQSIQFSLITLLVSNIVPFIYFGIHSRYWYSPTTIKKASVLLGLAASTAIVLLLLKLVMAPSETLSPRENLLFTALHMAPLILTLLVISHGRTMTARSDSTSSSKTNPNAFAPVPINRGVEKVGWDQLIIDDGLKHELTSVIDLLKDPKTAKKYGIEVPKGILLNGPPGTGKTSIAKVIANTANLSFFVLKMDEVVSKWVGESEKNLTKLFDAAVAHSPAVIFIDEVDSIGKSRSGNQAWADNLLNHLLQLVDGVIKTEGVYIIAATNRADLVDSALKRAGRLNKVIEVPLPDAPSRARLFELYMAKLNLEEDLDIDILSQITEGKSPADIREICNQAGLNAFKRESGNRGKRGYLVTYDDLEQALREFIRPE